MPFSILVALALALSWQAPAPSTVEDKDSQGRVVARYEVQLDQRTGAQIKQGEFESFYANGRVASAGKYSKGKRKGPWKTYFEDGTLSSEGNYKDDLEDGRWTYYFESGRKHRQGRVEGGRKQDLWAFWKPDGTQDGAESGFYRTVDVRLQVAAATGRGDLKDEQRHGHWVFTQADGSKLAEGSYRAGAREGTWSFWRAGELRARLEMQGGAPHGRVHFWRGDRVLERRWISGTYDQGVRTGPLPEGDAELARAIEPLERPAESLPQTRDPARYEWALARARELMAEPRPAERELFGPHPDPELVGFSVLEDFRAVDFSLPEQRQRFGRAQGQILVPLCGGADPRNHDVKDAAPEDCVASWFLWRDLMELGAAAPTGWHLDVQTPEPSAKRAQRTSADERAKRLRAYVFRAFDLALCESISRSRPRPFDAPEPAKTAKRADKESAARAQARAEAIRAGLDFLARRQRGDGSWSSRDADNHPALPAGFEPPEFHVATTALALQAFLASGSSLESGPDREVVARATGFLLRQCDAKDGAITSFHYDVPPEHHAMRHGPHAVKEHALALRALAEGHAAAPHPLVGRTIERAISWASSACNYAGGWGYTSPPDGKEDSANTAFMLQALCAAQAAGCAVNSEALLGALQLLDSLTDAHSGRTGYTSPGVDRARVPGVNQEYHAGDSSVLTALALEAATMMVPQDDPQHRLRQAQVLIGSLPHWDESGLGNDFLYWCSASQALFHYGGAFWSQWNAALERAVLPAQRQAGVLAGSWDPNDAWGMFGGRYVATAELLLALEAPWRRPRSAPAANAENDPPRKR